MGTHVRTENDGDVAVITLDRPERLNAVTPSMGLAYAAALRACDDDPAVRVVVVTGAGRAFCAGADLAELAKGPEHFAATYADPSFAPDAALRLRTPVVVAANGPVAGLGLVYLLGGDVRFLDPTAVVQTSFARLGMPVHYGLGWLLPRVVGLATATELMLSSRRVEPAESVRMGLAHRVCAPGASLAEALAYAHDLAATCSPSSWAAIKAQLLADGSRGFDESLADAYARMREAAAGPDLAEALAAREEGRPARFPPLPPHRPLRA